jgi:hypothetical protein
VLADAQLSLYRAGQGRCDSGLELSDKDPDLHITNRDQNNAGKRAMVGLGEHGNALSTQAYLTTFIV